MAITAQLVKELRESTGAGMMDAKKALVENNGDMDAAVDWLRTKGLAKAAKKADRVAAEGLVGVAVAGTRGVAVEVNSETDFVAKNEQFQDFVRKTTEVALGAAADDVEALKAAAYPGGGTVADTLTQNVATIGENQQVRRMKTVAVSKGAVVPYIHTAAAPGLGKIGALGIKVSRHCTYHGVALNVAMDLEPYSRINPCGYTGLQTVDLSTIGVSVAPSEAADVFARKLVAYLAP